MVLSHTRHHRANVSPSTLLCVSRLLLQSCFSPQNTLSEPCAAKAPCYSLSYLWIKSLLPLHCTNNFFFLFSFLGNIISSYSSCILTPSLSSHSKPKEDEQKWGQNQIIILTVGIILDKQWCKFPLPQQLLARNKHSQEYRHWYQKEIPQLWNFQIIISPILAFFYLHLHSAVKSLEEILRNLLV